MNYERTQCEVDINPDQMQEFLQFRRLVHEGIITERFNHCSPDFPADTPTGVSIVGGTSSGKTTFTSEFVRRMDVSPRVEARGTVGCYRAGKRFRIVAAVLMDELGADCADDEYLGWFDDQLAAQQDFEERAYDLYSRDHFAALADRWTEELNRIVSIPARHPDVRADINRLIVRDLQNMHDKSVVLMEGRNPDECRQRFTSAGILPAGTIMFTSAAETAAYRMGAISMDYSLEMVHRRNASDRGIPLPLIDVDEIPPAGRIEMNQLLPHCSLEDALHWPGTLYALDPLLKSAIYGVSEAELSNPIIESFLAPYVSAGINIATNPVSALVIRGEEYLKGDVLHQAFKCVLSGIRAATYYAHRTQVGNVSISVPDFVKDVYADRHLLRRLVQQADCT